MQGYEYQELGTIVDHLRCLPTTVGQEGSCHNSRSRTEKKAEAWGELEVPTSLGRNEAQSPSYRN